MEMAASFPQSENELLDIYGVGAVKCKKYGPEFLNIIRDYRRKNPQIGARPSAIQ